MSEKVGEIYFEVSLDTREMIADQRKIARELENSTKGLGQFEAKLTQVATAVASYAVALYLIKQSDAFTSMNAQLKLATESTRELAIAQGDVKRIAQEAQADIAAVASLYAKVSSSTRELGIAQTQVSDITRSVSLALKVSGASAAESGAAIMQLGQAFASGVLRGDEFNSVAEAAPRLMKALADGIGVPIGQLRAMAAEGKLTSEVLATALPKALRDLEQEAKQVQTISGAFQELKNEVMLFVGEQTAANGVVALLTGSIGILKDSLGLLVGVMATVAAVKFANWLQAIVAETYAAVAANVALKSANLATAQANAAATAATAALTAARVAELRASVMAAEGATALAIVTNGLIPAQARAAAAAEAHAASLVALSTAQRAASVTGGLVQGALGFLGGPIGAITTLLGLGATAWALWGSSAADGENKATAQVEASTDEIVAALEKQIAKLKERNALAETGMVGLAKGDTEAAKKMASLLTQINDLKAGKGIDGGAPLPEAARQGLLQTLLKQYAALQVAVEGVASEQEKLDSAGKQSKASEWLAKYATDAERLAAELKKAKDELGGAFTPEIEKRITEKYTPKGEKAAKSSPQVFDSAGYLAELERVTASGVEAVNLMEQKAIKENDELLAKKGISFEEHQRARTLILSRYAAEREAIEAQVEQRRKTKEEQAKRETERSDAATAAANKMAADILVENDPVAKIKAEYRAKEDALNEHLAATDMSEQLHAQAVIANRENMNKALADLDQQRIDKQLAAQSQMFQGTSQLFGNLADLAKQGAGEQSDIYKTMFAASKAFAIADAVIKIQQAMASAAMSVPWPGNLAAIGSVVGATAGIVSTIASTNISGGRQYGGPVNSGNLYRVNEKGAPEMFTAANGSQYMMPTASGRVTAADQVGSGALKLTIINNTSAPIGQVTERSIGDGERALIISEAASLVAAQLGDPNSGVSRSMSRNFSTQRSR